MSDRARVCHPESRMRKISEIEIQWLVASGISLMLDLDLVYPFSTSVRIHSYGRIFLLEYKLPRIEFQ